MGRRYLQEIEIVGATMVYREGNQCRYCLDWLCNFCDRVIILLDNFDSETENIVLEYKNKYKDKIYIIYSDEPVSERTNRVQGQMKRRFKQRQVQIRELVLKELRRINKDKPVDMFIFLDSDEVPINQFFEILKDFWYNRQEKYIMTGFVEVFNNFKTLIFNRMAPHGRVFRFDKRITAFPSINRTRYHPYIDEGKPWKVRNVIVHLCRLTEEYRKNRQFCDNVDFVAESMDKAVWILPKDVREMKAVEIADYQPGHRQAPSKYPSITLKEYLLNNK